ncbi:Reverse transcriptase (RNA-dependent DNA polymerase) [Phytophthora infestans]|uniref:Reverse transcriptase (RNA-dependent DNA polymerase) n=1 Tax=Phytophthora infestans TaxID=4787 RepID=A0A833TAD2_PHYIN|nr:Reverse transcriptase (RNA-dependent DNA polymerase) [Phytophthora infestans]
MYDLQLRQGDVPNAYLKSALDKSIYLKPPIGTTSLNDGRVWLLLKGLYELKQSGKARISTLPNGPLILLSATKWSNSNLGLNVGDIFVVSQDIKLSDNVMTNLASRFSIKDLGDTRKC